MDQIVGVEKKDAEFWKGHVLKSQEFLGSDLEYCRVNGLTNSTFATYKKRLGFVKAARPRDKISAFTKIEQPMPGPVILPDFISKSQCPQKALPSPKWLAELILALHSKQ